MTANETKPQILMIAKDDCWKSDYIVNATSRLEAAEMVATKINRTLEEVKELYRPVELNELTILG